MLILIEVFENADYRYKDDYLSRHVGIAVVKHGFTTQHLAFSFGRGEVRLILFYGRGE